MQVYYKYVFIQAYSDALSNYTCMQVCRKVCKFVSMKVCRYPHMNLCEYESMEMCKFASIFVWMGKKLVENFKQKEATLIPHNSWLEVTFTITWHSNTGAAFLLCFITQAQILTESCDYSMDKENIQYCYIYKLF